MSNIIKQALGGIVWTFLQQSSLQLINFIIQIFLARLLGPGDFGLIALLVVFISLGQLLMDGGMTTSLIRTNKPTQADYSTVFITNIGVSLLVYFIIFLIAPYVAEFYNQTILTEVLRLYSLTFVIRAFAAVHVAKLTKEMNFKKQAKLQIPSTIVAAFVGVIMAYNGFGVWSLVWLNLLQVILFTVQIWIFSDWKPSMTFDKSRFKYHFNFGYKMTLSGIINTIYLNVYTLIIGKLYTPIQTGYFNQAERLRIFPASQISAIIVKVTFPMLSNIKDEMELKKTYVLAMKFVFIIIVPIMFFLIVSAEEIFIMVLGDKWLPAVGYFQILCLGSIVYPIGDYNVNILKVKGRSDMFLKLEVLKKIIGVIAIIVAISFDIYVLIICYVIAYHIMVFLDAYFSGKLINYSVWMQIKDLYKIYLIGILTFIFTYLVRSNLLLNMNNILGKISILFLCYFSMYLIFVVFFEKKTLKQVKIKSYG